MNHPLEERVKLFQKLHQNIWFHKMNYVLDVLKTTDIEQKFMLMKYGQCFYY